MGSDMKSHTGGGSATPEGLPEPEDLRMLCGAAIRSIQVFAGRIHEGIM
jgi:hypothetical protein